MAVRARSGKSRAGVRTAHPAAPAPDRTPPVPDPIITMDGSGIIQSASDSVEQVFGWTPAELFGVNVNVLIPEPRRSALDRYLDRYRLASRAKSLQRTRQFDAVRKDGSPIQIELSVSRADLPLQSAPFFIGIIRDVGRQIDVSADSLEARSRLQHLITEQTRALATANLRLHLTDRLASLGTLAAGLGHDMNNVLLPIRARLNALEHAGVTPAAMAHLTAVRRSIAYLQHLSDGLHFLALDPDGNRSSKDGGGVTSLSHWWSQAGVLLQRVLPPRVRLKVRLPARLPSVNIAPHWLTQAVLNLLVNAGEAMPATRRNPVVELWAESDPAGRVVRLGVSDNGRGMAPGIRRRAMDMFFTTKPRSMGTGLGLPMARKVAVRAGGTLELASSAGKGTSAVLVLPATARADVEASRAAARGRTGVVCLRDPRGAALLTQVLVAAGLEVKPARGGRPGEADLLVAEPRAAMLGVAGRWLGRRPGRAVLLLGAPAAASRRRWEALGATIIEPPDDFEEVRQALGRVIQGWSEARKVKP